jgi:hypothetical protein
VSIYAQGECIYAHLEICALCVDLTTSLVIVSFVALVATLVAVLDAVIIVTLWPSSRPVSRYGPGCGFVVASVVVGVLVIAIAIAVEAIKGGKGRSRLEGRSQCNVT